MSKISLSVAFSAIKTALELSRVDSKEPFQDMLNALLLKIADRSN